MGLTGYHRSDGLSVCFWWVLVDSGGFWWVLLDSVGFRWVLVNSGWGLTGLTRSDGSGGLLWVLAGSGHLWRVLVGSVGFW
jgi:hypothetical protein